jgi:pimeloyl-ACP methyl ester carboxylesterase
MAEAVEESWLAGSEMNKWLPAPDRVRCPVLVVGGEADNMVCPASVQRTAAAYKVAPVMMPRLGHMLPVECEAGTLAELLMGFRHGPVGA